MGADAPAGPEEEDCGYIVEGKFPQTHAAVTKAKLSRLI